MAENKTKPTGASVEDFLHAVPEEKKRADALVLCQLIREVTGSEPKMWGSSIVGFGTYTYTYGSGHTGDWPVVGFSPRKQNLTVYLMPGFDGYDDLMARLGKFKTSKACLYINKLSDIDPDVLRTLVAESVKAMQAQYPVQM